MTITETNLGEVRPLLARLAEQKITLPAASAHAAEVLAALDDESIYGYALPAIADVSPAEAVHVLREVTLARLTEIELRNMSAHLRMACSDAIAQGISDHLDDVLDQMRPAFGKAARIIKAAHAAGLRHTDEAADAIRLGPKAIDLWQKLPDATNTLDDIASTRLAIARATKQPPAAQQESGAFCDGSGAWNHLPPGANRWLALVDHDLRLNTDDQTREACRRPSVPPIAPSNPQLHKEPAAVHGIYTR